MKDILKLIIALTIISTVAGIVLAVTNKVTAAPIATAAQKETVEALAAVLPEFDNDPSRATCRIVEGDRNLTFHAARKQGALVGIAFETASRKGYGGEIRMMVGLNGTNELRAIKILAQQETPGLGTKVCDTPFLSQFAGRKLHDSIWSVRKDGGDFDAVTGATISSRAVLEAVKAGIEAYMRHADEINRTGE